MAKPPPSPPPVVELAPSPPVEPPPETSHPTVQGPGPASQQLEDGSSGQSAPPVAPESGRKKPGKGAAGPKGGDTPAPGPPGVTDPRVDKLSKRVGKMEGKIDVLTAEVGSLARSLSVLVGVLRADATPEEPGASVTPAQPAAPTSSAEQLGAPGPVRAEPAPGLAPQVADGRPAPFVAPPEPVPLQAAEAPPFEAPPVLPPGFMRAVSLATAEPLQATAPQRDPTAVQTPEGQGAYVTPDLRVAQSQAGAQSTTEPRQAERPGVQLGPDGVHQARSPELHPYAGPEGQAGRFVGMPAPPAAVRNFQELQAIAAPALQGAQVAPAPVPVAAPSGVIIAQPEAPRSAPGGPLVLQPEQGARAPATLVLQPPGGAPSSAPTTAPAAAPQPAAVAAPSPGSATDDVQIAGAALTRLVDRVIKLPDSPERTRAIEALQLLRRGVGQVAPFFDGV